MKDLEAATEGRLQDSLILPISRTYNLLISAASAVARREAGVSLTEWRMIVSLGEGRLSSSGEIANEFQIDGAQVSRNINALIERNLITSTQDGRDRRVRRLMLTAQGAELYKRIAPNVTHITQRLKCDFPPEQINMFMAMLAKIETAAAEIGSEPNGP